MSSISPPLPAARKPFVYNPNDSTPMFIVALFLIAASIAAIAIPSAAAATAIVGVDFETEDVPISTWLALLPSLGLVVIQYLQAPVSLALTVGFLIWVHGARRNLDALGAQGLALSAGWSVGAFFMPLLNLFMPFQAVNEIWRASAPTHVNGPFDWKNGPSSPRVSSWWLAFLIGRGLTLVSNRVNVVGDVAAERTALWLLAGANLFLFIAASLGAWMVLSIRSRQRERFVRLRIAADPGSSL